MHVSSVSDLPVPGHRYWRKARRTGAGARRPPSRLSPVPESLEQGSFGLSSLYESGCRTSERFSVQHRITKKPARVMVLELNNWAQRNGNKRIIHKIFLFFFDLRRCKCSSVFVTQF